MKPFNTQRPLLKRASKALQTMALTLVVAPGMLALSANNASAGWGGGYRACAKTPIVDVSDLTMTEGAVALGLDTLASILPESVAELLDSSENITLFAPTDEAFANIPQDIAAAIVGDEAVLTTVLAYHVTPKKVDPRRIFYIRKLDTLADQDLFASRNRSEPKINQSNVSCEGYRTANGLVWVIDSVLLPQF